MLVCCKDDTDPYTLSKGNYKKVLVRCDDCGKEQWAEFTSIPKIRKKYCIDCKWKHWIHPSKGKKHSEETKLKMSKSHRGKNIQKNINEK